MKIKSRLISLLALVLVVHPVLAAEVEWFTDINVAMAKAKAENKFVMLDFTGSDWCGWCKKLKSEVFDQPEFAEFANVNFVMVEVDFPRNKPQTPLQQQMNQQLAELFQIKGYPTLIVLNSAGERVGAEGYLGYVEGGPKAFIAVIEKIPGVKHVDPPTAQKPAEEPEPPRKPADYTPIAPTPPVNYGALALKSISGPMGKRFALINNQTMMVGETASVKVLDGRVTVSCKEIRDDSVLITVNGKPMELKLGGHK